METSEVEIRAPGDKSIKISRWKVKSGSKVGRGALLALYETAVTKGLKLKSTMVGTVSEVLATDADFIPSGTVLLKMLPCSHPVVMKDMCADCGADLRKDAGVSGTRKEPVSASVAMVHNIPELIISKEQALELGKADEENLLKNRKLVLLVDLDQTLIHTTNDDIPPKLKDVYHFQIRHGNTTPWFHTKLRPGTQAFLEKVSKLYELHICTFGSRMYAHIIANFLDPDGKYFSHRILSRDECFNQNSKTANLKALFPCGDSMVCIIDDREDVWNFSPNLIHVKPYRFFQGTADINAPPGLDKTEHDAEPVKHKVVRTLSRSNSAEEKQSNSDECVKPVINTESEKLDKKADLETINGEDRQEKSENTNQNEDKSSKSEVSEDSSSNQNNSSVNLTEKILGNTEIHGHDALHDSAGVCRENGNKSSAEQKTCITDDGRSMDGEKGSESKNGDSQTIDSANGEKSDTDKSETKQSMEVESSVAKSDSSVTKTEFNVTKTDNNVSKTDNSVTKSDNNVPITETDSIVTKTDKSVTKSDSSATKPKVDKEEEMEELIEWVDEDDYLLYLEDILKRIHEAFYNFWDQAKSKSVYLSQKPDLKFIIPYVKRKVLKGTNILFSGVIPTNQPPENSRAYQVARNLGATVQKDFVPKRKNADNSGATTHVVAAKLGTVKVKTAQKHKYVKLVNVNWLWACVERLERCEEKLYTVGGTDSPSVDSQVIKMKKRKNDGEVDNNSGETLKRIKMENTVDDSAEGMEVNTKMELSSCEDPPAGSSKKSEIPLAGSSKDSDNPKAGSSKDNDDPPAGTSQGSMEKSPGERRFSNSYNPFLAFSDLDLACMDKEVEDFMEEGGEDSEEEDIDRDSRIRSQVLSSGDDDGSSSEDSLSGETPRGWNIKRNRRSKSDDSSSSDHDNQEEVRAGDEESENELDKYEKTVAAFAPDTESSDAESVGSVDEEMAAAIEREFMS